MARRRRVAWCDEGCGRPARRGGRRWCAECFALMRRPKKTCSACSGVFAADLLVGKRCRPCISQAAHSKRIVETYGLTAEMYAELLAFQDGRCFICHRRPASKRLAVDHDHGSGAVRGLLCKACNRDVLGHLRDDPMALARAIHYLSHPPAVELFGELIAPGQDVTSKQEDS